MEVLIGFLGAFVAIVAIATLPGYFRTRERLALQATLRSAIERGEPLPQQVIDAMTSNVKSLPAAPPVRQLPTSLSDMRVGAIWLAVGLGIAGFGWFLSYTNEDVFYPMAGIGFIPGVIGLTYIVLSFLNPNQPAKS
eukprot:gene31864-32539_t